VSDSVSVTITKTEDRRVFRLVNGIRHSLADRSTWVQRGLNRFAAVRLIARSFEFHTLGVARFWGQGERFTMLAREIDENEQEVEIIVAHSYGTTVAIEAVRLCGYNVDALWLVQGACQSDFEKNGLNTMLKADKIGDVHVLWSDADTVLKWARWTTGLLKFGWLGLTGPVNIAPEVESRVHSHFCRGYGHNTILDTTNLPSFLDWVVKESERQPVTEKE
jgi:hypothetical protein